MARFVTRLLQLALLAIVATVAAIDIVWARADHFDVDVKGYGVIALLALICAAGGIFYERVRKDDRLAAMLIGTSFLLGMSASFSFANYLLATIAGPRIDEQLAAIDRAMGVDWPALMAFMTRYPTTNAVLQLIYLSVLPQIALMLVLLGVLGKPQSIYGLSLAVACGAAVSILVWTLAPSFGAFSIYHLPKDVSDHIAVALDGRYAQDLVALLHRGPGHISPSNAKGLIGFPSYHAALALIVTWYARELPYARWAFLCVNAMVLFATPIQGGHHVIDVVAGVGVAALAVLFSGAAMRLCASLARGGTAAIVRRTEIPA